MLTEKKRPGEFILSEGNGTISREVVTISTPAAALVPGTVLGKITATGEYKAYSNAAGDGSETAAAILYGDVPVSAADVEAVVIARDAEVSEDMLTGFDSNARTDLAALGIIVR